MFLSWKNAFDLLVASTTVFYAIWNYSPQKNPINDVDQGQEDEKEVEKRKIKDVCIFCGSRTGNSPEFQEYTEKLVKEMNCRNMNLVYGGGNIGIMGMVARGIDQGGGKVTGIIPQSLAPREISGDIHIGTRVTVPDMHTRKLTMYRLADAFIALPGGFGTFEELLEIITWQQLGIHSKPIGLYNINGFYDPLVGMFEQAVRCGFIDEKLGKSILVVESDPKKLLDRLEKHQTPKSVIKWMDEGQI